MTLPKDTAVAGVFTRSKCPSAPVDWCRKNLAKGTARALVVNSGNANAFTGKKGAEAVKLTADIAAEAAGCRASQVFIASTGVIGEPLDATKFGNVLHACEKKAKPTAWLDAAKAIMTTDTFPKVATRTATIGGVEVTINGIAKGAGMIAPDMATMLVLRLHRCAHRGPGAAGAAEEGRRQELQLRDGGQRYLHLRHAAVLRHRRRCRQGRARDLAAERPPPEGIPQRARRACCATSPSRSPATARARASSSP